MVTPVVRRRFGFLFRSFRFVSFNCIEWPESAFAMLNPRRNAILLNGFFFIIFLRLANCDAKFSSSLPLSLSLDSRSYCKCKTNQNSIEIDHDRVLYTCKWKMRQSTIWKFVSRTYCAMLDSLCARAQRKP